MDENFSPRVKDVIQFSKEEAIRLAHNYIGTEHLLLGIIREGEGMAIDILQSLRVDLKLLRNRIEEVSNSNSTTGSVNLPNIPLTKQAEKALKTTFLLKKSVRRIIVGICHVIGISRLLIDLSKNCSGT